MLEVLLLFAGLKWQVSNPADWHVKDNLLDLVTGKEPPANQPRRPMQFALADTKPFKGVHIEVDAEPHQQSLIIVYAYRDSEHFDYAHLSVDTATKQPHHNGIFHVYGGERVRISKEEGPPAFPQSGRWYHVVLDQDATTGSVNVTVDGKPIPALHAVDVSLTDGKVGLGSFDETAAFKNFSVK
jgi:hypothetical protein